MSVPFARFEWVRSHPPAWVSGGLPHDLWQALAPFPKISPGIAAREAAIECSEVVASRIEPGVDLLPRERRGNRSPRAAAHRIGRQDRLAERVAEGIGEDAPPPLG